MDIKSQLQVLPITEDERVRIMQSFEPFYKEAEDWLEKAKTLIITSEDQVEEMKQAREARLALQKKRTGIEKKRVELKEDSVKYGKAVDSIAKTLKSLIEPAEKHLKEQEEFAKKLEEKRIAERKTKRFTELKDLNFDHSFIDVINMDEESYQKLRVKAEDAHEAELKREEEERKRRKEEEERKAEELRLQKIEDENKEKERAAEIALEEDKRKKAESKLRKERAARKEAEAEADRIKEEQRKELEERERKQREEQEAQEAKERARLEEERKAAAAPDKEKLKLLANSVDSIELPNLTTVEAKEILKTYIDQISNLTKNLRKEVLDL